MSEERAREIYDEMHERVLRVEQEGGEPPQLTGWVTVLIQDVQLLRARVEELERQVADRP